MIDYSVPAVIKTIQTSNSDPDADKKTGIILSYDEEVIYFLQKDEIKVFNI